jgi:homogentisate 1,2-dioxygenase
MATEIVGIIYGEYKGTSRDLRAGGLSFQSSYMPHGGKYPFIPYKRWVQEGWRRTFDPGG